MWCWKHKYQSYNIYFQICAIQKCWIFVFVTVSYKIRRVCDGTGGEFEFWKCRINISRYLLKINTSESDYKLYIQGAYYIFKGPIIYSRGLLYILNGALSLVNSQIELKIIIQKIKVKTSGLVNAKHLITYSWSWRHSDSTVFDPVILQILIWISDKDLNAVY